MNQICLNTCIDLRVLISLFFFSTQPSTPLVPSSFNFNFDDLAHSLSDTTHNTCLCLGRT
jgi:hypothetical protein